MIQAAGVCFDACGNFLSICRRTSRVLAFDPLGKLIGFILFPDGVIEGTLAHIYESIISLIFLIEINFTRIENGVKLNDFRQKDHRRFKNQLIDVMTA